MLELPYLIVFILHDSNNAMLESEIFKCTECNREFELGYQLEMHKKHYHKQTTSFKCDHCSQEFSLKEQLDTHTTFYTHSKGENASERISTGDQPRKLY